MPTEEISEPVIQIVLLLLSACCILLISSLLASASYFLHRKYGSRVKSPITIAWIGVYASSAIYTSTAIAIWLSLPRESDFSFVLAHCHQNVCGTHLPAVINFNWLNSLAVLLVIALIIACLMLVKVHDNKLTKRINCLLSLSQQEDSEDEKWFAVTIIRAAYPLCLNAGIFAPKLVVSSHLAQLLEQRHLRLLLVYEYSKAKQFKNLKLKLIQILTLMWPASIRRLLILDFCNIVDERAFAEVHELLGYQQVKISSDLPDELPDTIKELLFKFQTQSTGTGIGTSISGMQAKDVDDAPLHFYIPSILYIAAIILLSSNLTHLVIELVG